MHIFWSLLLYLEKQKKPFGNVTEEENGKLFVILIPVLVFQSNSWQEHLVIF